GPRGVDARGERGDVRGREEPGGRNVHLVRVGHEARAVGVGPPERLDVEVDVGRRAALGARRAEALAHSQRLEEDAPAAARGRRGGDAVAAVRAPERRAPAGPDAGEILLAYDAGRAPGGLDARPAH